MNFTSYIFQYFLSEQSGGRATAKGRLKGETMEIMTRSDDVGQSDPRKCSTSRIKPPLVSNAKETKHGAQTWSLGIPSQITL